jgi:hypothetical protein
MPDSMSLREALRRAAARALTREVGLYLPHAEPITLDTPCILLDMGDGELNEFGVPPLATALGFPTAGLDVQTIVDTVACAEQFQSPPSDELLLESFLYYWRNDAFLPCPDAPPPPPPEEQQRRDDREFYDLLGAERHDHPCRNSGCARGAITHGVFCRVHHFEMIRGRACPFDD